MEKSNNEKRTIWEKRISEQEASGLARKPWCARHGIQYTTFRYWLEKTGKLPVAKKPIVRTVVPAMPTWLELSPASELPIPSASDNLVVRIGEATVELRRGFDPELLREIMRALASA